MERELSRVGESVQWWGQNGLKAEGSAFSKKNPEWGAAEGAQEAWIGSDPRMAALSAWGGVWLEGLECSGF